MEGAERFDVMISQDAIAARVAALGVQITRDYAGKDLVLVGVLKGAVVFLSDLARAIDLPLAFDFLGLSSYGDATQSSGVVRITQDLSYPIGGKDVLIVEDIVDTGLTLRFLIDNLESRQPRSIKVATLLHKPANIAQKALLDYVGFTVEDRFVVGYGLDFEQKFRNLPFVGVRRPEP